VIYKKLVVRNCQFQVYLGMFTLIGDVSKTRTEEGDTKKVFPFSLKPTYTPVSVVEHEFEVLFSIRLIVFEIRHMSLIRICQNALIETIGFISA
jgi:hypothetical protein